MMSQSSGRQTLNFEMKSNSEEPSYADTALTEHLVLRGNREIRLRSVSPSHAGDGQDRPARGILGYGLWIGLPKYITVT